MMVSCEDPLADSPWVEWLGARFHLALPGAPTEPDEI